ncbi:MAG: hypothetical protein NVSMB15_12190 [Steroidobacteraceae bacterium]
MWPFVLIAGLALAAVVVVAMPASLVTRLLPAGLTAEDFSGSLWHGSAGRLLLDHQNAGALEWRLRPWPLLSLHVSTDLHWVKGGFVADGAAHAGGHGVALSRVEGGGPIEDLRDLGIGSGWRGTSSFKFSAIKLAFSGPSPTVTAAVGDFDVHALVSPQIAHGADLGGYRLHFADAAIAPGSDLHAELSDLGGPLEIHASIHFSTDSHTGMLSGTVKARPDAPPALLGELENLTQLHSRNAAGAIPVDLEFTL